ncbi:MAG: sulfide/dihydroorotate dehydrogenase-like FAD/NAD-binding protein, partial [Candidatus Heimdallarchaeota archaeon]
GQFVIVRLTEGGERIPLTIADKNAFEGYITLIFQIVGKTTALMRTLNEGDVIKDMVGPLGKAAEIKKLGTVIMVGGGTGVAILHHITKAFKEAGNYVISIIGAREKDLLILEEEMRLLSDEMIVTTDDGSYGERGFVTGPLEKYLEERTKLKQWLV